MYLSLPQIPMISMFLHNFLKNMQQNTQKELSMTGSEEIGSGDQPVDTGFN